MDWCERPFIEYLDAVDDALTEKYGITSNDTNMDLIASCQECNQTPEECAEEIGEKYDLENINEGEKYEVV